MMHIVTGGSGSGKSAYAEGLVLAAGEKRRIYIATMQPFGEEGKRRVERHRRMRREKRFETIECYTGLSSLRISQERDDRPGNNTLPESQILPENRSLPENQILSEKPVVLLECISNLTANEMYDEKGAGAGTVEAVVEGVRSLKNQASTLIIVTNEVFSDGIQYDPSTMKYLERLGRINQELAAMADRVTEVVYGIPVKVK